MNLFVRRMSWLAHINFVLYELGIEIGENCTFVKRTDMKLTSDRSGSLEAADKGEPDFCATTLSL